MSFTFIQFISPLIRENCYSLEFSMNFSSNHNHKNVNFTTQISGINI